MSSITSSDSSKQYRITFQDGKLHVPDQPLIPFIEGDGIGQDIWQAAMPVVNAAVEKAYGSKRSILWQEVFAGQKAQDRYKTYLPDETLTALKESMVAIKGPLATPVGGGMRSLNVTLRKELDLYVCQRPVRWFEGLPSPMRKPENVNMVIFRENTEDIYAGIEFPYDSDINKMFLQTLKERFPGEYKKIRFPETSAFGIKPISREGSHRLIRAAIHWALKNHRRSVTLVHKGNIMKYTEGAFRTWGYELAEAEFGEKVYTRTHWERTKKENSEEAANHEQQAALDQGKLLIKDMIADIAFEQVLTRTQDFDVLATMNLNGDYLSDAIAAQVGGVGIAPGANINYNTGAANFEATHGTAPDIAGKGIANPSSLILSAEMMLRYLGWFEAADLVINALEKTIAEEKVTFDLHRLVERSTLLNTIEFGEAVVRNMRR